MRNFEQGHRSSSSPALGVRDKEMARSAPHRPTHDAHRNGVYPLYADQPWMVEYVEPSANTQAAAAQAAASRWSARIASPVLWLWSRMRREWELQRGIMELRALDDRMLKDIGVSRCQIENPVRRGDHCGW
jgi:uncharacterized protein YjiS (DUF1127 family)